MVRLILVVAVFFGLSACHHLQPKTCLTRRPPTVKMGFVPPTATWAECTHFDNANLGWSISAVAFGVLSGGSGGVTAFLDDVPKYATAGVSLGLGVFTGVSSFLSTYYAKKYTDRCTQNEGGR